MKRTANRRGARRRVPAASATTGLAADPDPPNQGDPDKVLTVLSGYACSGTVVPGAKVEGGGLARRSPCRRRRRS